ncbi:MAG: type IV pilus twitching motility protein PilT [Candidatus Omnitrophica bacterium]|nr:type IV pilus twitching motility protein PilT [Candidatus Omnitrophota bacterium]
MEITDLLQMANDAGASDIILVVGSPPAMRISGSIVLADLPTLTPQESKRLIFSMLNDKQRAEYEEKHELDTSYTVSGMARFRINVHQQRGSVAAAMRRIPLEVPNLDQLSLPKDILKDLCSLRGGLVLVTGQTGSGKTTTLAAMIDIINKERACHIITIEDPIEFLHKHKKSIVEQREVYIDSDSFPSALRNVMRQNPDIILIGEMRDLETITTAVTASETGQLVFATLHTIDASETINRIIDVFPWRQQQQIRVQLSTILRGVISQRLIPAAHGKGLVVACEILLGTPAARHLIREGNVPQLQNVIETSAKHGMQSMDQALLNLYNKKLIDKGELLLNLKNKDREEIKNLFQ